MSVWGDRWMAAVQPSTAGSQQGEIQPNGTYTASRSPPRPYRKTTPLQLSPVVMESSSSHHLSSDFASDFGLFDDNSTLLPPTQGSHSQSFDDMFLFESPFCLDGGESFPDLSNAVAGPSSLAYTALDFNAETRSCLSDAPHPPTFSSVHLPSFTPSPFSSAILDLFPESHLVSDPHPAPAPGTYPNHGTFSDWMPPPAIPPIDDVPRFMDELPTYNSPLSYSAPSQNAPEIVTAAWSSNIHHQTMPLVGGGYSTPPMSILPTYSGYHSPHSVPGNPPPFYHRSGSGSPLAVYSGQSPQYYPPSDPSLSPLVTRTASSGSVASLFPVDNYSPHTSSEMFSRTMPGLEYDYRDFEYSNHFSSPHSGAFTGSPNCVSEGLEMCYVGNGSRTSTIPVPFRSTLPLARANHPSPHMGAFTSSPNSGGLESYLSSVSRTSILVPFHTPPFHSGNYIW
ncbi:hypothetical protein DFH08DRAFT_832650 [Mycena albidolilacea]|uniref:Uncharacterized protein n=1 Tax=Mycena albidolilacea TaxID=1033008 RepID=A0AAD7F4U9_9AGAR|nr:hypothetical protein DFH08DRAFT_832650 [Mycena albidolilacea]